MAAALMRSSIAACPSVRSRTFLGPQHRHQARQHRSQQLARRAPQHRPAQHEPVLHVGPVHGGASRPDGLWPRRIERMPLHRPGVVPVPAGQLDKLIQDPPLPGPSPVR
ncbi:hypothetical protein [Arthrobacter sp. MMS24-S77]